MSTKISYSGSDTFPHSESRSPARRELLTQISRFIVVGMLCVVIDFAAVAQIQLQPRFAAGAEQCRLAGAREIALADDEIGLAVAVEIAGNDEFALPLHRSQLAARPCTGRDQRVDARLDHLGHRRLRRRSHDHGGNNGNQAAHGMSPCRKVNPALTAAQMHHNRGVASAPALPPDWL